MNGFYRVFIKLILNRLQVLKLVQPEPIIVNVVGPRQARTILYQLLYAVPAKSDSTVGIVAHVADLSHICLLRWINVVNNLILVLFDLGAFKYNLLVGALANFPAHAFGVAKLFMIHLAALNIVFVVLNSN